VLDAAMGTRLLARGLVLPYDDPALWNLTHPEFVLEVHARDVAAGAEALITNTFGANRTWLARFGYGDKVLRINRCAVGLAREAAGPTRTVLGAIGPTALRRPGDLREQAETLLDAGVDVVLVETSPARPATVAAVREGASDLRGPLIVSCFDWPAGPEADSLASEILDLGAIGLGYNCCSDLALMAAWAVRMRERSAAWLLLKPSAGDTRSDSITPDALAGLLLALAGLDRVMVGGCCGTTETHIASLAAAVGSCIIQKAGAWGAHPAVR
jgi:methionine synthase I (cobalamin-dependent)